MKSQRFNSFIFVDFINVYAIIAYKLAMTPKGLNKVKDLLFAAEPIPFNIKSKVGTPD